MPIGFATYRNTDFVRCNIGKYLSAHCFAGNDGYKMTCFSLTSPLRAKLPSIEKFRRRIHAAPEFPYCFSMTAFICRTSADNPARKAHVR